jgi:hypothetical protein
LLTNEIRCIATAVYEDMLYVLFSLQVTPTASISARTVEEQT